MTEEEKRQLEQDNKERRLAIQAQLANTKTPSIYEVEVDPKVFENQSQDPQLDPDARKKLLQTLSETSEILPSAPVQPQAAPVVPGAGSQVNSVLLEALLKVLPPDQLQKLLVSALTGQAVVPAPVQVPAPTLDAPDLLENTLSERRSREQQTSTEQQQLDDRTRREVLEQVSGAKDDIDFIQNLGGFR
jgi:hypothetical protein